MAARLLGEAVTTVHTAQEVDQAVAALTAHAELRDRMGLHALRAVHDEHLTTHRVDAVLGRLGLPPAPTPTVSAVVPTVRPENVEHVVRTLAAQRHPAVELVLVAHGIELDEGRVRSLARDHGLDAVQLLRAPREMTLGAVMNLGVEASSGTHVAKMDDDNLYGPHYLSDLVRAFSWTDAQVVGKWAHYAHLQASGATLLRFEQAEQRYTALVQGGTMLMPREVVVSLGFEDLPRRVDTTFCEKVARAGGRVYSADRFNFVSMRSGRAAGHTWPISDHEMLSRGGRLVSFGDPTDHVMT